MEDINLLTEKVIGLAIEVHRELGPGLLESAYEQCLCYELSMHGLAFQCQQKLPVRYKGVLIDCHYQYDILIENRLVVEVKAVDEIHPVHEAQLLTYQKLLNADYGLLLNFNVPVLKEGIRRRIRKGAKAADAI
jgi:GxxExxY protein